MGIVKIYIEGGGDRVLAKNMNRPWNHLKSSDNWDKPGHASEEQAHLMVQMMESWFMADKDTLKEFYGNHFNGNALPGQADIEVISKADLLSSLENASRHTTKGKYGKGAHAFKIWP